MACAHANCTAKCSTCILAAASEFSAWACCLKRWVLRNTPQSTRGFADSPGSLGKIRERAPSLKSDAKSHRITTARAVIAHAHKTNIGRDQGRHHAGEAALQLVRFGMTLMDCLRST